MGEKLQKIGNSYWRIGQGIFGCSVEEYKVIDTTENYYKLNKVNPDKILIFETSEKAQKYLDDKAKTYNQKLER